MIDTSSSHFGLPFLHVALLKEWLPFVLTPLVLVGYDRRASLTPRLRRAYVALLVLVVLAFGGLDAARAWRNVVDPPEFDVQAFYVAMRVGASGGNFYDPRVVHRVAEPLFRATPPISSRPLFIREVLDAGYVYPPPTMLWMAPFGRLNLVPAAAAWYALLGAALVAYIALLRRVFFPGGGRLELGLVAALTLLLRATYTTFAFAQTSVLVALALALTWRDRERPLAGLWVALGILVKPIFAFFLGVLVLRRNWRAVGVASLVLVALTLLSLGVYGREVMTSFVARPVQRIPPWLFVGSENQSLLAALLRVTDVDPASGSPLTYPPFVVAAAITFAITCWFVWRLAPAWGALALATAVPAALLIYPQTLEHYAMLNLVPMLYLWTERDRLGLGGAFVVASFTLFYALTRYDAGSITVVAHLLEWLLFVGLGVRVLSARATAPGVRPALDGVAT
jgi:hypothetical protein